MIIGIIIIVQHTIQVFLVGGGTIPVLVYVQILSTITEIQCTLMVNGIPFLLLITLITLSWYFITLRHVYNEPHLEDNFIKLSISCHVSRKADVMCISELY